MKALNPIITPDLSFPGSTWECCFGGSASSHPDQRQSEVLAFLDQQGRNNPSVSSPHARRPENCARCQ